MTRLHTIQEAFLHLLFPHVCSGCGSAVIGRATQLCMRCIDALPCTGFESMPGNPAERLFYGRLPLASATAQYYFSKESLVQRLMHQFKYRGNRELGHQLGRLMGEQLRLAGNWQPDALVPLPLFPAKEKKRGFNQAAVLCEGMASVMQAPVLYNAVTRPAHTETQTNKGRIERWKNMEGKFFLPAPGQLAGKQLLLVDDVITTGATLESCGQTLLQASGSRLSIATLCIASMI